MNEETPTPLTADDATEGKEVSLDEPKTTHGGRDGTALDLHTCATPGM